ncbi:MAG: MFS transporter [Alphaproteobacteria bacterium]|nr:MFS transporter [Alphaproteobacteria bacterium]
MNESFRLPLSVGLGWGLGTVVTSIIFNTTNLFLIKFMTDHLGLVPLLAGALYAASKIYDGLFDPVMGVITDRSTSKHGRRRPFLLWGAAMGAASLVMLFNVPDFESSAVLLVYLSVALILFSTGYTFFNVPYVAMPAEMTSNPHERSVLMSYRAYATATAQAISVAGGPFLVDAFGGGRSGFGGMSIVLAALVLIAGLSCFILTKPAPATTYDRATAAPLKAQFRTILVNRPFLVLLIVKSLMLFASNAHNATMAFFTTYILKAGNTVLGTLGLAHTIGLFISQPLWVWLSKRLGKRTTYIIGALGYAAISVLWIAVWAVMGPGQGAEIYYAVSFINGVAGGGIFLMPNAMLPDTIAHGRQASGQNIEGSYAAIYALIEKVAQAGAGFMIGAVLSAFGYIQATKGVAAEQPESALSGIIICFVVVPAIALVVSSVAVKRYRL